MAIMEEWDYVDNRDLQNWKGGVVCMTCQPFAYGVDEHCRTMAGCNLRQKQLQQGQHLKKRCKLWTPTLKPKVDGTPKTANILRLIIDNICSHEIFKAIKVFDKIVQTSHQLRLIN